MDDGEVDGELEICGEFVAAGLTFARIQVTIAYADYNEHLLNRWCERSMPPDPPREEGESDDEYVLRCAHTYSAACPELGRREKQAVENARARVAAAKRAKAQPNAFRIGE